MPVKKSIYLSDDNLARLEKIAVTYSLYDKDHQPDILGAMRYVIEHFELGKNDKKLSENECIEAKIDKLQHMVEQINVTIPHLYYNARMSSKYAYFEMKSSARTTDEDVKNFVSETLIEAANTCGQIQENLYDTLYCSMDNKKIKTIPIEEDKNQWK